LEKDFVITSEDFLNLFASAYITSRRKDNFVANYKLVQFQNTGEDKDQAIYLKFNYPKKRGFFDFSVKQFDSNKREPNKESKINDNSS
jgi:hypothetical protein